MTVSLRHYQREAIDNAHRLWSTGTRSVLAHLATGLGKTVLASHLLAERSSGGRALWIAHRDELIRQAATSLERAGLSVEIEKADERAHVVSLLPSDVVVATVQTLQRGRLRRWHPDAFSTIVIDEAHHAPSRTYRQILDHFRPAKVLGLSVGPESCVELRGGVFGAGFVGSIQDAFDCAVAAGESARLWNGFDVIDWRGVEARGWEGGAFRWKPCKRILRHAADRDCTEAKVSGRWLLATNDHSFFRAAPGSKKGRKYQAALECVPASSICTGDILPEDDGAGWAPGGDSPVDVVDLCARELSKSRVHVECDVVGLGRGPLRDLGMSPQQIHAVRKRGSIPLATFKSLPRSPLARGLRVEGWSGCVASQIFLSDWAYVLGFFLGDGWINENRIAFAVEDKLVGHMREQVAGLPGVSWNVSVRPMPGASSEVQATSAIVAAILRQAGIDRPAWEKAIPSEWIVSWPRSAREQLLRGLIDSDGYVSSGRRVRVYYTTTSKALCTTLLALLRSLGLHGSVHERPMSPGGEIDGRRIHARRPSWTVHWAPPPDPRKRRRGTRFLHDEAKFHERLVREVRSAERPEFVYDLEMEGHPSFVANGVLVHNTATPDRSDAVAMEHVFDDVALSYGTHRGIGAGYLVPVYAQTHTLAGLDLDVVRTIAGDLAAEEIGKQLELEGPLHEVLIQIRDNTEGRQTVVFMPTVSSARALREVGCRDYFGQAIASIDGKTSDDERKRVLAAFAAGDVRVLVNVNVLVEGWDCPGASCIVMARPTRSRALYAQAVGRVLRPLPGVVDGLLSDEERRAAIEASTKPNALILDLTGRRKAVDLIGPLDILAGDALPDGARAEAHKKLSEGSAKSLEEVLEEVERNTAVREAQAAKERLAKRLELVSKYVSEPLSVLGGGDAFVEAAEAAAQAIRDNRKRACGKCGGNGLRSGKGPAPCGVCKGKGRVKGSYEEPPPSEAQRAYLAARGIALPKSALRRQASAAIDALKARDVPTLKEARVLSRAGLPTDVSHTDAQIMIKALADKYAWQPPDTMREWAESRRRSAQREVTDHAAE